LWIGSSLDYDTETLGQSTFMFIQQQRSLFLRHYPRRANIHIPGACYTTTTTANNMINFAKGHPNRTLLPVQEIRDILNQVSLASNEEALADSLNYPKRDPGTLRILEQLQAFLDRHTNDDDFGDYQRRSSIGSEPAPETHFFMTHGVSHGLDMLCTAQTSQGDVVLVEQPTYFLAAGIFQTHGLVVKSLPMKHEGVDLDKLELDLENGTLKPPRMIYIIPTHQNPTASVMPIVDRWKLARIARRYGILVVADEVYHLLDWRDVARDGQRPARMAVVDCLLAKGDNNNNKEGDPPPGGCCVSVSSFTKIFAPGVRSGWVEGPMHIVKSLENIGYIQSQGGCTPLVGELMHASLKSGIGDRVLAKLNAAYRERSKILCEILASENGVHIHTVPTGGYFVWVSFDGVADTNAFLEEVCVNRGVRFLTGQRCDVTSGSVELEESSSPCRRYARFCFADLDVEDIKKGANLVLECYRAYLKRTQP
jgi:DNA-binding transcriptional MocR family regulator